MTKKILYVGSNSDTEIESVRLITKNLKKYGCSVFLFKQDTCLELGGDRVEFSSNKGSYFHILNIAGERHLVKSFSAIFYSHPTLPLNLRRYKPERYRQFIHKQFFTLRESLWLLTPEHIWFNPIEKVLKSENKIYQKAKALEYGLSIPNTLISSDPQSIKDFYLNTSANAKKLIYKVVSASPIQDEVFYTNEFTEENIKKIDSVVGSPIILQERVEKDYELRIIYVAGKIFSAKIDSQKIPDSEVKLDWRKKPLLNDFEVPISACEIPKSLEKKIVKYMQALGLRYGALDFILDKYGNYIFLEVNPSGQWYFVQSRTSLQIAKAIAEDLAEL